MPSNVDRSIENDDENDDDDDGFFNLRIYYYLSKIEF
jgi:hypothetical protein